MLTREKYWGKISCHKKDLTRTKKYNKNDKNTSYLVQTYFDWIKAFSDIMKKVDIIKIYFVEKFILIELKYTLISYENPTTSHLKNLNLSSN